MSEKNSMTRREALKKMGMVAAGIGLGIGGVNATDVLGLSEKEEKRGKMKVLAINGSSRKDGNTADMLNLVLGELKKEGYETEHIQLAGHTINPCKACFACAGKKNCVLGNDMFQELYQKMTEADASYSGLQPIRQMFHPR
nr:flavodoxin family protein [Bacteroides faecichinchillae]